MAITTVNTPSKISNVRNPFWFTFSSNNSTQTNFRFVLDVFTGSTGSSRVFRDKQFPEPSTNRVNFSPNAVLKDYVAPEIYHIITASTASTSTILNYSIQVSEEYGSGSTGTTIYGPLTTTTGYCLNSVATYQELPYWNYTDFLMYTSSTNDRRFLTNSPSEKKIREGEYETLSFLTQVLPSDALDVYFRVIKYRTSGGTSTQDFSISNRFYSGTTANTEMRVFHFGVGPANLNPVLTIDLNFDTEYKYECFIYYENIDTDVQLSETRTFLMDSECSRFPTKRFMFQNRLGTRDYFTATMAERRTTSIDRTTYQKNLPVNYSVGNRGVNIVDVDAQDSIRVSTNWLNDDESTWLKELFTSTDVYEMLENGDLLPIIITNTSEEIKQRVNDKLIRYEISYNYAFKYNV